MDIQHLLPSDADFVRIEDALLDRVTVRHHRQVVRHRLVAVAVVVVLAGAGVAAGTVANNSQQLNLAYCYGADSAGSKSTQAVLPNNGEEQARAGVRPDAAKVATAVAGCTQIWESGYFGSSSSKVPKLQPCLQDNLTIAVFPRKNASESADAFCDNLGLSAP
jgi:hypothetical protein